MTLDEAIRQAITENVTSDPDFPDQLAGVDEAVTAIMALREINAISRSVQVPFEPGSSPWKG